MKSYSHLISRLYNEPLLITPQRHAALCHMLELRLAQMDTQMPSQRARTGDEIPEDDDLEQRGATAIIPVHGTIVMHASELAQSECGCVLEDLNSMIDAAENDPAIERVIYDFRTPGGGVTGVPETGRKILHSRKETIAFTSSECASGGIWLAAQCQRFYATQSSRIGSVGVYCLCLDLTSAMKKDGVKVNAISAGKYKLLGASFKPMTDDERAILQAGVNKTYAQFKEAMESHRVVSDEHFGSGRVFDGDEAAELGFTDGTIESMDELLENLVE